MQQSSQTGRKDGNAEVGKTGSVEISIASSSAHKVERIYSKNHRFT